MIRSNSYYTLLGSLPALPTHYEHADRMPISRLRLDGRLKMLEADDRIVIEQVADFLVWDRQPLDRTDEDVCVHYDEIMSTIHNPLVREVVTTQTCIRTIVSAIRRRKMGLGPPPGVEPWSGYIARNWKHPDFRLGARFPWIGELDRILNGDSPLESERTLHNVSWETWKRLGERYHFSFEAVILYLVRWEIVYRWISRDAAAGRERFEHLVTEAMGEYANLYQ